MGSSPIERWDTGESRGWGLCMQRHTTTLFMLRWLAQGCVFKVIKGNNSTYEQLSVLLCHVLMDNMRVWGRRSPRSHLLWALRWKQSREVRRREQVDSETKCAKVRFPISPQLRGAGWSSPLPDCLTDQD